MKKPLESPVVVLSHYLLEFLPYELALVENLTFYFAHMRLTSPDCLFQYPES